MRHQITLAASLVAASLVGTALVAGASNALATPDAPAAAPVTAPVEVARVETAAPAAEPCLRKVRVVYGGYSAPNACAR